MGTSTYICTRRTIWRAIGWNGCLSAETEETAPTDDEFKTHFEALLNKNHNVQPMTAGQCPYVPVLDDAFSPVEVEEAVKKQKNKAFAGVCAGLFRYLPFHWIAYLTQLLIFTVHSTLNHGPTIR